MIDYDYDDDYDEIMSVERGGEGVEGGRCRGLRGEGGDGDMCPGVLEKVQQ
jgi:hypothetical protein